MGAILENTVYSDFQCAPQRLSVFLSWAPVVSDHGDIKSIFLLGRAPHLDKVMDFLLKVQRSFKFCIQVWQIKTFFVYYSWMRHSQIHLHSTDYTVNSMHSACLHVYFNGGPNISCLLFCVLRAFVTTMFEMQFTRVMHALIETEGRLQCSLTFCLTPASTLSLCQLEICLWFF